MASLNSEQRDGLNKNRKKEEKNWTMTPKRQKDA
jgi:hypothetical protein